MVLVSPAFAEVKFVNRPFAVWEQTQPDVHLDVLCYTDEEYERIRQSSLFLQAIIQTGQQII